MPSSMPLVLVVEDEPLLRMAAVDMVEAAGFQAMEAADAAAAVKILESRLDVRIVFTDIDMPRGMNGMRLAEMIRNRWPPIHLILTSGHFNPPSDKLPTGSLFFPKPYWENDVVEAMRKMTA